MSTLPPLAVGSAGQTAGREMPRMRPTRSSAPVSTAPVEPAETKPAASGSSLSIFSATTREESFFWRMARVGASSLVMTSLQCTTERRSAS